MSEALYRQQFLPGELIFREGEAGDAAYVIDEGAVEIAALRHGQEVVLAHLTVGELFGEMALLDGQLRSATARALETTTLVVIHRDQVERQLVQADPLLNLFVKVILERLRSTNSLVDRRGRSRQPPAASPDHATGYDLARERAMSVLRLEQEMRSGLEQGQFETFYQPIVNAASGHTAGFEALARWHHPDQGLLGPGAFIGLAERTGLVVPLGSWVLRQSLAALPRLQHAIAAAFPTAPPAFMAINLSAHQIADPRVVDDVAEALKESGVIPAQVKLEVTESAIMADPEAATAVLARLKALGVLLAVDDFGTGYSSLSYLARFPVDVVKIDQSFVSTMLSDDHNLKIVRAVTRLAKELGLEVVAEGVERPEEVVLLRQFQCEYLQGYLFSRALSLDEAEVRVGAPLMVPQPPASRKE